MPATWTITALHRPPDLTTCYCKLSATAPEFMADYHASGDTFIESSGAHHPANTVALWASYFLFLPPPARRGEDGAIMRARQRLEHVYNDQMTDAQRLAWLAYLAAHPPRDAAGHKYVVGTPPDWYAVAVQPYTQYAWSQIFGVYRIGIVPILDPASVGFPSLAVSTLQATTSVIQIAATSSHATADSVALLLYTTPPWAPDAALDPAQLRPVGQWTPDRLPRYLDITDAMFASWDVIMPGPFGLTLFAIDKNNMLVYNSTITTITVENT